MKNDVVPQPQPLAAIEAYGRLIGRVDVASYAIERAHSDFMEVLARDWTVGGRFDHPNDLVTNIQSFHHVHMDAAKRKETAKLMKKAVAEATGRKVSNEAIAGALGVNRKTIDRDLGTNVPADTSNGKDRPEANGTNVPVVVVAVSGADAAALAEKKAVTTAKRTAKEAKREERREENREKVKDAATLDELIEQGVRVPTIVIDPPWDWGDEGDQDQLGRARPDYATMTIEQLLDYPVGEVADVDCHLYCWITNRSLPKGFALVERWGFRYITMLSWPKPSFGMGNYFRGQTEHVLFGVKGEQSLKRKDASTLLPVWDRGPKGHSSKPPEFHEFVETCSPGPYLEIFSRINRPGWTAIGENTKEVSDAAA